MKRSVLFFCFIFVFLSSIIAVDVARAEEEKARVTVGLKTWINTWNVRLPYSPPDYSFGDESTNVITVGPVINIRRGKFFVGGSALIGTTEYERELNSTTKLSNKKQDYDVAVGYYPHPNVGVFAGYKYARWEITTTDVPSGLVIGMLTIDQYGPLIGLTANYPIGSTGVTPFATYSHYFLRRVRDDSFRYDESGPSIEAGLAYSFRSFTAIAGYKYQHFFISQTSAPNGMEARYKGFMFSLNYTF